MFFECLLKALKRIIGVTSFLLLLAGCSLFENEQEEKYLIDAFDEPSGLSCELGGIKIGGGRDKNGNHRLDPLEVTSFEIICHEKSSEDQLSLLEAEKFDPYEGYPFGWFVVFQGFDEDNNGDLYNHDEKTKKFIVSVNEDKEIYVETMVIFLEQVICPRASEIIENNYLLSFDADLLGDFDVANFVTEVDFAYQNGECTMELFNKTDGIPITGSTVTAWPAQEGFPPEVFISNNCRQGFPHKPIELAIRITPSSLSQDFETYFNRIVFSRSDE